MTLVSDVVEYRILRAQRYILRTELEAREQRRLSELERRFEAEQPVDHEMRRHFVRFDVTLTATLQIGPRTVRATVNNISGGGLSLTTHALIKRGEIAHLRVADDDGQLVYDLPVQVQWTSVLPSTPAGGDHDGDAMIGCAFIGIPATKLAGGTIPPQRMPDCGELSLRPKSLGDDEDAQLPVPVGLWSQRMRQLS